jgi:hypothetical protein
MGVTVFALIPNKKQNIGSGRYLSMMLLYKNKLQILYIKQVRVYHMSVQRDTSTEGLHKLLLKLQGVNTSTGVNRCDMSAREAFKKAHAHVVDILNPATAQHKRSTTHHHSDTAHYNQHATQYHQGMTPYTPAMTPYNQHTTQYHQGMPPYTPAMAPYNQHTPQYHPHAAHYQPAMPRYNPATAQNSTPPVYSYT